MLKCFSVHEVFTDEYLVNLNNTLRWFCRMGRPMTILVAVIIWVAALLIAIPQLLYFITEYLPGEERIICYSVWPDGHTNNSKIEFG